MPLYVHSLRDDSLPNPCCLLIYLYPFARVAGPALRVSCDVRGAPSGDAAHAPRHGGVPTRVPVLPLVLLLRRVQVCIPQQCYCMRLGLFVCQASLSSPTILCCCVYLVKLQALILHLHLRQRW